MHLQFLGDYLGSETRVQAGAASFANHLPSSQYGLSMLLTETMRSLPATSTRLSITCAADLNMRPRKGSISYSNRLSAVFTLKLTDAIEKYDPSGLSVITSPGARSSKESSRSRVQDVLDSAKHAEAPTEPYLIQENTYPSLRSLRTDADIGDGIWMCCYCLHENILRHWKGPFPFKYLHCDRCSYMLCPRCHSSEILTPWPFGLVSAPRPAPGREVRYCHICTNCGLTHRAEMEGTTLDFYGVTCAGCGASSYGDWPRYYIGSVEPYRRDPDSSFIKLVEARAEDAAKVVLAWDTMSVESRSPSRLSCRNPE